MATEVRSLIRFLSVTPSFSVAVALSVAPSFSVAVPSLSLIPSLQLCPSPLLFRLPHSFRLCNSVLLRRRCLEATPYVTHIPRNIPEPSSGSSRSSGQLCTLTCDRTFETISEFRVPFTFQSGFPHFVGSCNGILCFINDNAPGSNVFYLWNHSIRKFKRLPDNQFLVMTFGIGYGSQNNDFKVVGISWTFAKSPPPKVGVYSLNSDSWKRVELGISLRPNVLYYNGNYFKALPFVSGHLHWMFKMSGGQERHSTHMLLSFDVNSEKFKQLPLPDDEGSCLPKLITSFKGKLAMIKFKIGAQQHSMLCSIWVMREYGVIDSWNKLRVLSIENFNAFISFTKFGLLLIQKGSLLVSTNSDFQRKYKNVLIDSETLQEKEIGNQVDYRSDVAAYMENLVLLDGANVVSY
uniref:F-box associated beta-propeller type 1 domain-containing protein n=1 Tax=Quercus lobata TaxID=97700 RepID=A0A7N2RAK3_QUELO